MDLTKSKKIHEGKFSLVYLVEKGGHHYIVKQLHPRLSGSVEDILRFKEEANLPFIAGISARILDLLESDGKYYMVKEYLPGITLKEIHSKYGRKKYQSLYTSFYIDLCKKLTALHQEGIIHGDIKPSNLLFGGNDFRKDQPNVRLLDLGLALQKNNLPLKNKEKRLHFSMLYSAPELMLNEPECISELTDIFSTGVCMYESYGGDPPYNEGHPAILLQMMLAVALKKQKTIPDKVYELISVITAKPAFTRPVSQYSVEEALQFLKKNILQRAAIGSAEALKLRLKEC